MIQLITGPMYSGKSAYLLESILKNYSHSYLSYLFIRPEIDTRGFITRNKQVEKRFLNSRHNIEELVSKSFTDLLELDISTYHSIFIDELHLFEADDAYDFFKKILYSEVNLIVSALNGSSEQESFATVNIFFPFITDIVFLKTECFNEHEAGEAHQAATYTKWIARKMKKGLIEVGDSSYAACCRECLKN